MPDTVPTKNHAGLPFREDAVTADYYVAHYKEFLPRYISKGHPTRDTLNTYMQNIDEFLAWCQEKNAHPFSIHDYQMRIYIEGLNLQNKKQATIALRVSSVRTFFQIAVRLGLLRDNPCSAIRVGAPFFADEQFKFFTPEQVGEILEHIQQEDNDFLRLRATSIILLMANEGLRIVEIKRMNDEDIQWATDSIYVRGKGHTGFIYPSAQTMKILQKYISVRPKPVPDGESLTPTFISNSHKSRNKRLTRHGIREIINPILSAVGYKEKGISCHVFRHSCGTNLYAATKDLRVVQETLRQRDPKVTARYAHVQQRMEKRETEKILPDIDLE